MYVSWGELEGEIGTEEGRREVMVGFVGWAEVRERGWGGGSGMLQLGWGGDGGEFNIGAYIGGEG